VYYKEKLGDASTKMIQMVTSQIGGLQSPTSPQIPKDFANCQAVEGEDSSLFKFCYETNPPAYNNAEFSIRTSIHSLEINYEKTAIVEIQRFFRSDFMAEEAIQTAGLLEGDRYVVNGQKVWISRIQHSDLMILLARTTPLAEVTKKSEGMSIFIVDLRDAIGHGMTVRPIRNMVNHETNELFFENLEIPVENLIGEEGKGFKYILDGLNAERALIAAECIGDGFWFIDKVTKYANERIVFGRPISQNQGVQFPIAKAYVNLEAASLMRYKACELFDAGKPCGAEANMAKMLAADASWEAANACLQFHGGFGFASEYDVERKFRETRLYQVAPISTNLILSYVAEHVLGMPRSF
jgi:acyl-CoA dehydrogenase